MLCDRRGGFSIFRELRLVESTVRTLAVLLQSDLQVLVDEEKRADKGRAEGKGRNLRRCKFRKFIGARDLGSCITHLKTVSLCHSSLLQRIRIALTLSCLGSSMKYTGVFLFVANWHMPAFLTSAGSVPDPTLLQLKGALPIAFFMTGGVPKSCLGNRGY